MSDDVDVSKFPRFNFYGYDDITARAISKKELAKLQQQAYDQEQQTQHQLEEYHQGWCKKLSIINRIVGLEKDLKHPLDLFDIYASRRFTNAEIDSLNEEGILRWLLGPIVIKNHGGSGSSGSRKINLDQSMLEPLHTIIQLHSRSQVFKAGDNSREMEVRNL